MSANRAIPVTAVVLSQRISLRILVATLPAHLSKPRLLYTLLRIFLVLKDPHANEAADLNLWTISVQCHRHWIYTYAATVHCLSSPRVSSIVTLSSILGPSNAALKLAMIVSGTARTATGTSNHSFTHQAEGRQGPSPARSLTALSGPIAVTTLLGIEDGYTAAISLAISVLLVHRGGFA